MGKSDPTAGVISPEDTLQREIDLEELEKFNLIEKEREASEEAFEELDLSALIADDPTGSEEVAGEPAVEEEDRLLRKEEARVSAQPRIRLRTTSGSYTCSKGSLDLDFRIDIDGKRPLGCVSGDFFTTTGYTKRYFGSFAVHGVRVQVVRNYYLITGIGTFTWKAGAPKVQVIVPRRTILQTHGAAQLRFLTMNNKPGARYICYFNTPYFRVVQLEQDHERGVPPFRSYDTGQLPSGGPRRRLSVTKSYREAGIDMQESGEWNSIDSSAAGANASWSNSELHQAMTRQFSMWREHPQWKVWLLAANKHDYGPGLYGIMFDQHGKQRQGCAAFHLGIGGNTPVKQRLQLYCYVHELGHCFNLFHSFHKSYMDPPMPNRPNSLSWMNYPRYYRDGNVSGETAFWQRFPFVFDTLEVRHLRHGFWLNVLMGGHPFGKGASLVNPADFSESLEDNSGLRLDLNPVRKTSVLGEPVHIELKLSLTDLRGRDILTPFHPYGSMTRIAIRKPSGDVAVYEPLMEMCYAGETKHLSESNRTIYDSAYIGFGKEGFYFDQVGTYELRGVYHAPDGSEVVSGPTFLRVRPPMDIAEEEIADVYFGTDQGNLFWLEGSGAPDLSKGMDALKEVTEKHAEHRLAHYARKTIGMNLIRGFKVYDPETRSLSFTQPNIEEGLAQLDPVLAATEKQQVYDNIEMRKMTERLAQAEIRAGEAKSARGRADRLIKAYTKMKLSAHTLSYIKDQIDTDRKSVV